MSPGSKVMDYHNRCRIPTGLVIIAFMVFVASTIVAAEEMPTWKFLVLFVSGGIFWFATYDGFFKE
jgi:hypothetical protein